MVTIGIDPIIMRLGHVALHWYGVIVASEIGIGIWLTVQEAKSKGFDQEVMLDNVMWIILAAFAGARLFHVVDQWTNVYAAQPVRALYIWEGGLAIWGGVLGGLAAVVWLSQRTRWRLTRLMDAIVPGLILG